MNPLGPTHHELLELDIDIRLRAVFDLLPTDEEAGPLDVYPILRAAYGMGYVDALHDEGQLCRDNGYRLPS